MDLTGVDPHQVADASNAIKSLFDAIRSAIGIVRDAKGLRSAADPATIEKALDEAEGAAKIAEAQTAKLLGYQLCHCTFPPSRC